MRSDRETGGEREESIFAGRHESILLKTEPVQGKRNETDLLKTEPIQGKRNEKDPLKRVKLRALDILTHRDKTEKELRLKLSGEDFSPEEVDAAVEYVKSYGYIDDERYARNYISYRLEKKSRMVLYRELSERGVCDDILEPVLDELCSQVDEASLIVACIEKKLKGSYPDCLPDPSDEKEYGRLLRFLAGRGYSFDTIRQVMNRKCVS